MDKLIDEYREQLAFRLIQELGTSKHDLINEILDDEFDKIQSRIIDYKVRLGGTRILLSSLLAETSGVPKPLHSFIEIELRKVKEFTDKP
jgi:hypothetical protein